jgi:hypothetical protein
MLKDTRMKKLLGIVLSLLALALPAQAQSTWETPQTATGGPGGSGCAFIAFPS